MASKMDMSLDDIITSTKTKRGGARGRGRGGRGGAGRAAGNRAVGAGRTARGGGGNRGRGAGRSPGFRSAGSRGSNADAGVWTHDKFQDGGARKGGAVGVPARAIGSSKITISNLHYGVSDSDIIELFGELGNIRYASVHYDRSGRSMGKADVTFERRAEAQAAIQQYNGVPLDGRPMAITWAVPLAATQPQTSPRSNLRQIQGKRINRASGGGGGFRGGRGRGGGGRGRGGKAKGQAPTAEELDAELDAYASNRV